MRERIETILRGTEFEIVIAIGPGDPIDEALHAYDPDICLLDMRAPDSTGLHPLIQLRHSGDAPAVVLLVYGIDDDTLLSAVTHRVEGIVTEEDGNGQLLDTLRTVARGEKSIPNDLLHRALELAIRGRAANPLETLARREREIAEEVARGARNREIGERLGMSEGTVKVYLYAIYRKLGIKTRTELALLVHGRPPVRES
ncbi:LuxR C-terminal-related transcriptional regulator [Qipengyuania spongiae]|uniref:Response regulator transcription factor n=1 Tax=Qipengyuania spongiae TaxID=2909673 RepID=A0ABY5SUC2_9SPHN|nr:response regulator transcription factor [Qipengyuania spongiae]